MTAPGKLVLVATPIGNLGDLSKRAIDALAGADLIVAEDTRRSGLLMQHLGLSKPLLSFFEGNQRSRVPQIIAEIERGKNVALITDAGSPTVSDPGYELVYACLNEELPVEAVPGPCAAILALQLSGLPPDRFFFEGFLPRKGKAREERLATIRAVGGTLILYESPNRLVETLRDLLAALGDVSCAVLREMTKLFEEAIRGPITYVLETLEKREEIKGEITLVVRLPEPEPVELMRAITAARRIMKELDLRAKDAATAVSITTGIDKKTIYQALIKS